MRLAEVTPPNCQAAHGGRGPKARGRGAWGRGKKVARARGGGRRRRRRQRPTDEACCPQPCAPTLSPEARGEAKGGPGIRTGARACRPSPAAQALPCAESCRTLFTNCSRADAMFPRWWPRQHRWLAREKAAALGGGAPRPTKA